MEPRERAQRIITDSLCLAEDETLLVVTDDPTSEVGMLFYDAAQALGRKALIMRMPELIVAGQEPPAAVAAAMCEADVALCPTAKSITHTNARIKAAATGTRVVTMPGITMDMLRVGASCADYAKVEQRTLRLTEKLTAAKSARIEKDGHILELNLDGRNGIASPGVYRNPGESG
ncbi:MAG: aminopeptidase, partial [Raoultibacter sp.]